ncbi:MAG: right-handed parallel beta-helix repeat-containing protein [Candidatus Acidiferrales bacterium]
MISRRKVLNASAMGVVLATLPFGRVRQAFGQSTSTFDYYISPSGDDNNAGTLSSPWSITALNSKMSTYAGKRVGIIGDQGVIQVGRVAGVATSLYSIYQSQPGNDSGGVLLINGGPSGSQPTYIGSSDSSGAYSARLAIIDAADPTTGAQPTVEAPFVAQNQYQSTVQVPNYGNLTVDGIVIRNFTFAALLFGGSAATPIDNVIIQNCEIYNQQNVKSNNNPGAVWMNFGNGALVTNCLIYNLSSSAAGTSTNMQACGVITFNSQGTNVTNCTFYNCCAISTKDGWQQMNVSYCYLGWGTFGSPYSGSSATSNLGGTVQNYLTNTGLTNAFHHNILIGPILSWGESSQANNGTVAIHNNTFYKPSGIGGSNRGLAAFTNLQGFTSGGAGTWQFYNNLVYAEDGLYDGVSNSANPAAFTLMSAAVNSGNMTNMDYNAYGSAMTFGTGWTAGLFAWLFSAWRQRGFDAHSVLLTSSPFTGTPAEANPTSFAISGPAATAGVGGAVCGANDDSGLVGCNFTGQPVPNAPTLSIG